MADVTMSRDTCRATIEGWTESRKSPPNLMPFMGGRFSALVLSAIEARLIVAFIGLRGLR